MSSNAEKLLLLLAILSPPVLSILVVVGVSEAKQSSVYLRVKPGMARSEVIRILGTPDLMNMEAGLIEDVWYDQEIAVEYYFLDDGVVVTNLFVRKPRSLIDELENVRKRACHKLTHLITKN